MSKRTIHRAFKSVSFGLLVTLSVGVYGGQTEDYTSGKPSSSVLGQVSTSTFDGANRSGPVGAATLSGPADVAVDPVTAKVFVADRENNRVLRFESEEALIDGASAEAVLGQPNFITTAGATTTSRFSDPKSIACDSSGRLWVLDGNRVLRFDGAGNKGSGGNADGVLGQPDFLDTTTRTGADGLGSPESITISVTGTLWVSCTDLNRVVGFAEAASKSDGADAERVFGQTDFMGSGSGTTRNTFAAPRGLAVDLAGNLYVADSGNNRVLRFTDAEEKAAGADADVVLGQLVFTTATAGVSDAAMDDPRELSLTPGGDLFVGDFGNQRVLLFENVSFKGDGGTADSVLGQSDFVTKLNPEGESNIASPGGIWADGEQRVWIADVLASRVLRFDSDQFQPDAKSGKQSAKGLKGNDRYNSSGAQQKSVVKARGSKGEKGFFVFENDGDVTDGMQIKATKGSSKLNVKYILKEGGNVTGEVTSQGLDVAEILSGSARIIEVRIKGTARSRNSSARKTLKARVRSLTDGASDTAMIKAIKTKK